MSAAAKNPFEATHGQHCSAADRCYAVLRFNRSQCNAALKVKGLQKTVARAIQARLRLLDRTIAIIEFEDHGQDFLRWHLDKDGVVIESQPFQNFAWKGLAVFEIDNLKPGSIVYYSRPGEKDVKSIRYPLISVTKGLL